MMPELGRYAAEVALAYAGTLALLAGVVVLSVHRARRVKRSLDEAEARRRHG